MRFFKKCASFLSTSFYTLKSWTMSSKLRLIVFLRLIFWKSCLLILFDTLLGWGYFGVRSVRWRCPSWWRGRRRSWSWSRGYWALIGSYFIQIIIIKQQEKNMDFYSQITPSVLLPPQSPSLKGLLGSWAARCSIWECTQRSLWNAGQIESNNAAIMFRGVFRYGWGWGEEWRYLS